MARPKKTGLDYFPVDVSFDEKIDSLEMIHGNDGLAWILKFWQSAYKTENGVVNFNGLFAELHAKNCRITMENHQNILKNAISVGFCYETEPGYYTSHGITKRIAAVSGERKAAIQRQEKNKTNKSKSNKSKVKETPHYSPNNLNGKKLWQENTDEGFAEYLKISEPEFDALLTDWNFISIRKEYFPGCCVKRTLCRMWEEFWGTKAGWENKRAAAASAMRKNKESDYDMNWRSTIERNFKKSICYYGKNEIDDELTQIAVNKKVL